MDVQNEISQIVNQNKIVLFMKGSPEFPQCGFSAHAVKLILKYTSNLYTVNVLEDPAIRDGVKVYSSWPTIPQLYVNGQFIGGCDIINDMDQDGELEDLFV